MLRLIEGEYCVSDLARRVGLSQSCTTRHLQVLLREGLVARVRSGKRVLFRVRDDEAYVSGLLEWALTRTSPPAERDSLASRDIVRRFEEPAAGAHGAETSVSPTAAGGTPPPSLVPGDGKRVASGDAGLESGAAASEYVAGGLDAKDGDDSIERRREDMEDFLL
jgi:DNA-binding transcriptional ArsR family regulator